MSQVLDHLRGQWDDVKEPRVGRRFRYLDQTVTFSAEEHSWIVTETLQEALFKQAERSYSLELVRKQQPVDQVVIRAVAPPANQGLPKLWRHSLNIDIQLRARVEQSPQPIGKLRASEDL